MEKTQKILSQKTFTNAARKWLGDRFEQLPEMTAAEICRLEFGATLDHSKTAALCATYLNAFSAVKFS